MPYGKIATDRLVGINFERMREYRLNRVREAMKEANIGTFITWDPYTIRYVVGGYVTIPNRWNQSQAVVLPINGDPYCFLSTSFSPYALREEMPWLKGKIWNSLGGLRTRDTIESLEPHMSKIIPIIEEHGLQNEIIGIDGCSRQMLVAEAFRRKGYDKVVDADAVALKARSIKNEDEIACLRLACGAADAAFEDIRQAIRPGIRECDLVGIGMKRLYEMGCDETQEFVCASGPRTNPLHIDFTDRAVQCGDPVVIDINGASYMGYKTCYYRTFICGKATDEQNAIYEEARKMMYDAMDVIKDGACTNDIRKVWPKSPSYWGYDPNNWREVGGYALGHGIGLCLHEWPHMFHPNPAEPNEYFHEGQCVAIETWAGKRGGNFGVRLEEDIVVTKDGYELLSKWPVDKITECWF